MSGIGIIFCNSLQETQSYRSLARLYHRTILTQNSIVIYRCQSLDFKLIFITRNYWDLQRKIDVLYDRSISKYCEGPLLHLECPTRILYSVSNLHRTLILHRHSLICVGVRIKLIIFKNKKKPHAWSILGQHVSIMYRFRWCFFGPWGGCFNLSVLPKMKIKGLKTSMQHKLQVNSSSFSKRDNHGG